LVETVVKAETVFVRFYIIDGHVEKKKNPAGRAAGELRLEPGDLLFRRVKRTVHDLRIEHNAVDLSADETMPGASASSMPASEWPGTDPSGRTGGVRLVPDIHVSGCLLEC